MLKILKSKNGEGYIDVAVLVLCAMLVIALAVNVFPVYIQKQQIDTFAAELIREAEISGQVGSETERREQYLREKTGLEPYSGMVENRKDSAQRGSHGNGHLSD